MANNEDDDSFFQEFMARAKRRQAKLSEIGDIASGKASSADVTYPPLSPLPEESPDPDQSPEPDDESPEPPESENREEISPSPTDLNYSSDLSLDCEVSEVYRAEPVVCHSSPEPVLQQYKVLHSPKKKAPTAPPMQQHSPQQPIPLQERQHPDQRPTSSQSLPNASENEQSLKELQLKIDRAEQMKSQLRKVVELSKNGSKEHIEAARLLKITEGEHLSFTTTMSNYKKYGIRKKTESLGSVHISNIQLKISPKLRNDLAEDHISHYFFCIGSCGPEVRGTEIISTNDIKRQDLKAFLQFKEQMTFVDLPPDFTVKVEVYELIIGQQLPKLLSRLTPSKRTKITPESNFKRVGSQTLARKDRNSNSKKLARFSEAEHSKYIESEFRFEIDLKPEQLPSKAGMLHVRCLDSSGRPDWSRFWVDLSCGQVRFWQSKQDVTDGKKPNQMIEFNDLCVEATRKLNPDDDLYRRNSFVFYSYQLVAGGESDTLFQRVLKEEPKYKIMKHQLAADSKEDRDSWCMIIDRSLQCFREWHGETKLYTQEQIQDIFSRPY